MPAKKIPLQDLLADIRACRLCERYLPLGPRPVLRAQSSAKLLIVGQAPGTKVHASGIPWNDPSGDRLRAWLGMNEEQFYDESKVAIVPMGFCYPGKGKSGDLPPRPECAEHWHAKVLNHLPDIELTLLVGTYAQQYYLSDLKKKTYASLTERVQDWKTFTPRYLPLVHPSPRNRRWLKNNPWFEQDVVPYLRRRVKKLLG
jgi:uracil-DNA glycosylase